MTFFVFLAMLGTALVPLLALYFLINRVTLSATSELTRDKAEIIAQTTETYVRHYLETVPMQAAEVASVLHQQKIAFEATDRIAPIFRAALAATPQVATLSIATFEGRVVRVFRQQHQVRVDDWSEDLTFLKTIREYRRARQGRWDSIFIAESVQRPFINYIAPLPEGSVGGVIIASVSLVELSKYLQTLHVGVFGTPFLLRGRDSVLAHPVLPATFGRLTDQNPLPGLGDVDDTALAHIWSEQRTRRLEPSFTSSVEARVVELGDKTEVFLFREIAGYDTEPWLAGVHLPLSSIAPQLDRLKLLSLAAALTIVSALLVAAGFSRGLTRPIRRLAQTAHDLERLEFEPPATPRGSIFREVNEVVDAFDRARRNLLVFGRYVPRKLVRRLTQAGADERLESTLTEVTVLFTDIVGFTAMSEEMSATQVEQFLNRHFSLLDQCVEATGGTTDKFIGDSLMAFWGAPEPQSDHAYRACQAARRIARAMAEANREAAARGERRIQVRIGIHSGAAVVGNIGSADRVNYTVVGDTVNIAERLQQVGRGVIDGDDDAIVVVSRQTLTQAGHKLRARPLNRDVLHGRRGHIETLALDLESLADSTPTTGDGTAGPAGRT